MSEGDLWSDLSSGSDFMGQQLIIVQFVQVSKHLLFSSYQLANTYCLALDSQQTLTIQLVPVSKCLLFSSCQSANIYCSAHTSQQTLIVIVQF